MSVATRQRIRWTKDQKQQILDEAARLHIKHPGWSNLQLIREAQKILPVEERRSLETVSWKDAFKWFADGIADAIDKVINSQVVQEAPTFSGNGKYQELESVQSEEPLDLGVIAVLQTLVKAMEELREETTKGLPIGIVGRLDDLQTRLDKIESRVEQFLNQGLLVRLVPAQSVQPVVHQEIPTASVKKPPPLEEPQKKTRKPRVMVVNTDSGHVRHGIEKGTQGYVSFLKFQDTYGVITPAFDGFDYVLAYKKTPIPWIEAALKFYPAGKFKVIHGGALQVSEAIRALPPIEIN